MVRTQVLLSEGEHEFLKEKSRKTGASLSALVRQAVDGLMDEDARPTTQRALSLLGAFEADRDDVSLHHDACFAEEAGR